MSTIISREKYGKLLADTLPQIIDSSEDHKMMMAKVKDFMLRIDSLNPEETALFQLMVVLIEDYENKHIRFGKTVPPLQMLEHVMDTHRHTAKDLWQLIGDKGSVSKILSGERAISKAQAKRLGEFYHVSPAFFI